MATQFNTSASFLSHRLFTPTRPRIGAITHLNVNLLPDFIEHIKQNLTSQELISLSEYQLQTYIMELSIKQKVTESFQSFVERILYYVRGRKEFWTNAKIVKTKENQEKQKQEERHQHEAIVQFQKDVQYIGEKMPKYDEKVFNNAKRRKIQQSYELAPNDFIGNNKQVLKINFTNYSMMPGYVLKQYLQQQKNIQKLPKYQHLSGEYKSLLSQLQNAVEYFLMQQKPKMNRRVVNLQRRQTARERRLPSYLRENVGLEGIAIHQHIQDDIDQEMNSRQSHSLHENIPHPNTINLQYHNLQQKQQENNQQSSEQQDSPCQFYHQFHQRISKKQYFESKMFTKDIFINQSHNIIEILRCLVYFITDNEDKWFQIRWRELEDQRVMREEERKKEEEEEEENEQKSEKEQEEKQDEKKLNRSDQQNGKYENGQQKLQKQKIIEQKADIPPQPIQIQQESLSSHQKVQKSLEQVIQIGIRKPIFDQRFKNPTNLSFKQLSRHLSSNLLSIKQIYFLTKQYINRNISASYQSHKTYCQFVQNRSTQILPALLDPNLNLEDILEEFNQMIQHPQNVKRSAFKTQGVQIQWDQTDYLMFLKGLLEYFFIPTNNRKIALYMMGKNPNKNIDANHVKYVKGIYLKNMSIRIDKGESGGGKKGRMLGKTDFIQKDIEFFSMKWFDKMKKSKKKFRRRRFDDADAGEQADSAY